jgi:hypothetical protein
MKKLFIASLLFAFSSCSENLNPTEAVQKQVEPSLLRTNYLLSSNPQKPELKQQTFYPLIEQLQ